MSDKIESEANQFAMELLMPTQFVRDYISAHPFDVMDTDAINKMAKKFGVAPSMMAIRIGQLCAQS